MSSTLMDIKVLDIRKWHNQRQWFITKSKGTRHNLLEYNIPKVLGLGRLGLILMSPDIM